MNETNKIEKTVEAHTTENQIIWGKSFLLFQRSKN